MLHDLLQVEYSKLKYVNMCSSIYDTINNNLKSVTRKIEGTFLLHATFIINSQMCTKCISKYLSYLKLNQFTIIVKHP